MLVEIPLTGLLDTSPIHKQLSDMEVSKGNLLRIVSPFFGKQPALEVADMATHNANPIYTRLGFREVTFGHPSTPVPVWCFVLQPLFETNEQDSKGKTMSSGQMVPIPNHEKHFKKTVLWGDFLHNPTNHPC